SHWRRPAVCRCRSRLFLTQSFWVCGAQPIFAAIDISDCQREACRPSLSRTIRAARARISGENLSVVLLMMLHLTQDLEPPGKHGAVQGICLFAQSWFCPLRHPALLCVFHPAYCCIMLFIMCHC